MIPTRACKRFSVLLMLSGLLAAYNTDRYVVAADSQFQSGLGPLTAEPQRPGDAAAGYPTHSQTTFGLRCPCAAIRVVRTLSETPRMLSPTTEPTARYVPGKGSQAWRRLGFKRQAGKPL